MDVIRRPRRGPGRGRRCEYRARDHVLQKTQSAEVPRADGADETSSTSASSTPRPSDGRITLAVLPLSNYSGDTQQDSFVDAMTEALIADLAQIKELRVISRTSVMKYRDEKKSLPQIGRELGVDVVVEGSVVPPVGE